jgi:hypothetical protein
MHRTFAVRTAMADQVKHSAELWSGGLSRTRVNKSCYTAH